MQFIPIVCVMLALTGCSSGGFVTTEAMATAPDLSDWQIDESILKTVQAQALKSTDTLDLYVPEWCPNCPPIIAALGTGDSLTRINIIHGEVPKGLFVPEAYPALFHPGKRLQLCGSRISKTMDLVRQSFGITPKPQGHAAALPAGSITRSRVQSVKDWIGDKGRVELGNKAYERDLKSLIGISAKARIPADTRTSWKTTDGTTRIEFERMPSVTYLFLVQEVKAVQINRDTIVIELPNAPDLTFKIQ